MPTHLVFLGFIVSLCGTLAEYTKALHKSTLVVTELKYGGRRSAGLRRYLVSIALRFLPCHDLYFDGRLIKPMKWFPGATSIYDLRLT